MPEEPENLVLQMLRRVDQKLDRLIDDVGDLKTRMTSVEEGLAGVNRRLDRLEARTDRVERRLELAEATGQVVDAMSRLIDRYRAAKVGEVV